MKRYADDETIRHILTSAGDTWAVVGLSDNADRDAWGVAGVLRRFGKRVVPVHPKAETVAGERGYASLAQLPFPVDVVDVFVNSARGPSGGRGGRDRRPRALAAAGRRRSGGVGAGDLGRAVRGDGSLPGY